MKTVALIMAALAWTGIAGTMGVVVNNAWEAHKFSMLVSEHPYITMESIEEGERRRAAWEQRDRILMNGCRTDDKCRDAAESLYRHFLETEIAESASTGMELWFAHDGVSRIAVRCAVVDGGTP